MKELGSVPAQGHTRIGSPSSPFYMKAEADAASKTLWVFLSLSWWTVPKIPVTNSFFPGCNM